MPTLAGVTISVLSALPGSPVLEPVLMKGSYCQGTLPPKICRPVSAEGLLHQLTSRKKDSWVTNQE